MSFFRRMLIMAAMQHSDYGNLILQFYQGVATLNPEGRGQKITYSAGEVTLSE